MLNRLLISYMIVVLMLILSFMLFFRMIKRKKQDFRLLVVISVLIALSVLGRILFAITPGFKPVTAMVIITGMYFGAEAGFLTGSLTALISNFYFGQGPWTPFQMIIWGMIGVAAGCFSKSLRNKQIWLYSYSFVVAILYSLFMDFYTVYWIDGYFNLSRYIAAMISAFPYTVLYAISNIIFMKILKKPIGKKLIRVRKKFGFELEKTAQETAQK